MRDDVGIVPYRMVLSVIYVIMVKNTVTRPILHKESGETGPQAGTYCRQEPSEAVLATA